MSRVGHFHLGTSHWKKLPRESKCSSKYNNFAYHSLLVVSAQVEGLLPGSHAWYSGHVWLAGQTPSTHAWPESQPSHAPNWRSGLMLHQEVQHQMIPRPHESSFGYVNRDISECRASLPCVSYQAQKSFEERSLRLSSLRDLCKCTQHQWTILRALLLGWMHFHLDGDICSKLRPQSVPLQYRSRSEIQPTYKCTLA